MRTLAFAALPLSALLLAACSDAPAEQEEERMEDRIEAEADASAAAAGSEVAALGLTEAQLLDADLVTATGEDLGDVEQVRRDTAGAVTGLVVELDDTDPDRWVTVPVDGLSTRIDGDDTDIQTTMTAADLAALPDAEMKTAPVT